MSFSHPLFLFVFLPAVVALFLLTGKKYRLYLLLSASLGYYAWCETFYAVFLLLSIIVNYVLSVLVDRYRESRASTIIVSSTIVFNVGMLAALKYPAAQMALLRVLSLDGKYAFLNPETIHLPIGISFFTFQAIAYVLDVYYEKISLQKNPFAFGLFMSLFPKIAAGPIIRYSEVEQNLCEPSTRVEDLAYGAKRFMIGIGKKVLIADVLSRATDPIFAIPAGQLTSGLAWLGAICYTIQIYFDFSGYSDMAIGLARMFGFRLDENFNYPYISKSVTEFWRRWHISLSSWLRDYLFLPLSYLFMTEKVRLKMQRGQYKTPYGTLYSIFIVFTICGVWHGSTLNFIVWGMFHGVVMIAEKLYLEKKLKRFPAVAHTYTLLVIMLSWILFRTKSLPDAFAYIKTLAGFTGSPGLYYNCRMFLNNELVLTVLLGVIGCYPIWSKLGSKLSPSDGTNESTPFAGIPLAAAEISSLCAIFMLSLMSVANTTHRSFIYFNF